MNQNQLIIRELIKSRVKTADDLSAFKRRIAKRYKIPCPSNISLLKLYHESAAKRIPLLEGLLRTRPVRSLSGIVNVSVLTRPYPCPGRCLYCPSEKGVPKSYVSGEPAVERAKILGYNPYLQVEKRIEMLAMEGHPTDKIELRIVGGTWSYYPEKYQEWFIKRCLDAFGEDNKMVGLSIETRPDFVNKKEIKRLRKFGVTRVELGVQSIYNDVLSLNRRGHNVEETIRATKLLKDAGFKISYQIMLNLPGSTARKDIRMFRELFGNPDFQPDLLKIYPCVVLKEAPLYQWSLRGKYRPYSKKTLIGAIKEIKKNLPYHVRVERIVRDIPSSISNLRQQLKVACRCIRCREIKGNFDPKEKIIFFRQDYNASGGQEIFLTYENEPRTKLYSLLRLRLSDKATIREIHTFGQTIPLSKRGAGIQHRGLGKKLIKKAESIAQKEFQKNKIAVIAAAGVRDYFRGLGYKLENTYMVKCLLAN